MWRTGLAAPRHVGSSRTRARTHVPRIGRRILNHCATREASTNSLLFLSNRKQRRLMNTVNCWGRDREKYSEWAGLPRLWCTPKKKKKKKISQILVSENNTGLLPAHFTPPSWFWQGPFDVAVIRNPGWWSTSPTSQGWSQGLSPQPQGTGRAVYPVPERGGVTR